MSKNDMIKIEGIVKRVVGPGIIEIEHQGQIVRAKPSGNMRRSRIKTIPGDHVVIAVSPYDLTNGLVVWRFKS